MFGAHVPSMCPHGPMLTRPPTDVTSTPFRHLPRLGRQVRRARLAHLRPDDLSDSARPRVSSRSYRRAVVLAAADTGQRSWAVARVSSFKSVRPPPSVCAV